MPKGLVQEFRDFLGSVVAFPADYFGGWFGVAPSESGVEVNELTAMNVAPWVGAVRLVSGAMSTLPFRVWETLPDGSERIAKDHLLDNVLNNQPNRETSAADFWQTVMVHIFLTGNAFAEKAYNGAGQPAELYLRSPFRTAPYRRQDGTLAYKTNDTPGQYERWVSADDMLHFRGLSLDSIVGLSPVKYLAREVLGNDLAAQSYSAKFFANDSRPGGYLKAANFLSPDKKKGAVESWIAAHSRGNAHAMALLDGGLEWQKVGVNPEEAQFLGTRKLNREQVSAITGVPVHFLGDSEVSRANMEQRSQELLTYTLMPWKVKLEQVVNMGMFPKVGRGAGRFEARIDTTMFLRATFADTLRGIQTGRFAGVYTVDEARKDLGLQPYTKQQAESDNPADKLWMPVNMAYVSMDVTGTSDDAGSGNGKGKGQGGNDQDGGDGGGKPPRVGGQGGKRDAEIQRYFMIFSRSFDSAVGRILARKKPLQRDFEKVFEPVLTPIASMFAFRADADPGDLVLSQETVLFIRRYIAAMSKRASDWNTKDSAVICGYELKRALEVFREKCAPVQAEEESTEEADQEEPAGVAAP